MFSLSELAKNGNEPKPIAFIDGGKYDKEVIYVHEESDPELFAEIDLTEEESDAKIKPIMDIYGRNIIYFAGQSGSGKSTMMAEYIKSYNKLHPKNKVYFIGRTKYTEDPAYKALKMIQLSVDKPIDFVKDGYKNCMFVFDDVATFSDKMQQNNVFHLIKDLAEVARKAEISVLISSHLLIPNEKSLARVLLNELDTLVIFPRSASIHHITYALSKYFGMSKPTIRRILGTSSRYVVISKRYPNYVLEEQHAYSAYD